MGVTQNTKDREEKMATNKKDNNRIENRKESNSTHKNEVDYALIDAISKEYIKNNNIWNDTL